MKWLFRTLALIALIMMSTLSASEVHAVEKSLNTSMVIQFSTEIKYSANLKDFKIALSYLMYPSGNPGNQLRETVLLDNGTSISRRSNTLSVYVPGADGIEYTGNFSFDYSYNSANGSLSVNGSSVPLNSSTYVNANAYPEAYVNAAVVGVGMNPQPFSLVKAFTGMNDSQIAAFNARANGEITDNLVLASSIYGTNIQTNTRLTMFVNVWKRKPDGTYDKTQQATRVQVIYTAADLMNNKAQSASWSGQQYFRQLVRATTSSHSNFSTQDSVWNGKYRYEYQVQDYIRTDYTWGYNGTEGAVSGITDGVCYGSTTKKCVTNYYKYTRYQIKCSNWWRTSFAYGWSSSSSVGDSWCKSNTSQPYFRSVNSTDTSSWTTISVFNGRSRTATGHTYQTRIGTMVWGSPYWQFFAPSAEQRHLSTRSVPLYETTFTHHVRINRGAVSIDPVDKITEGEVNSRVNTYATGAVDDLVWEKNRYSTEMPVSTYNSYANASRVEAASKANSIFREGHYWGLYLYLTGHWRAIEVPVGWYSMSAHTSSGTTLSGFYDDTIITPPLPDPDTETEIALVDFTYIESVFKQLKAQYPSYTLSAVQDKLIETLRGDGNNAAKKAVALYDSYIEEGMTKSNAFISISSDLNISLKD